nr:hypothetical protein [Planosporangium thailandense]
MMHIQLFSSWLTLLLHELKEEDRREQGGRTLGQQYSLARSFRHLTVGYGTLTDGSDLGVHAVDGLLPSGWARMPVMTLERGADRPPAR